MACADHTPVVLAFEIDYEGRLIGILVSFLAFNGIQLFACIADAIKDRGRRGEDFEKAIAIGISQGRRESRRGGHLEGEARQFFTLQVPDMDACRDACRGFATAVEDDFQLAVVVEVGQNRGADERVVVGDRRQ